MVTDTAANNLAGLSQNSGDILENADSRVIKSHVLIRRAVIESL
jgi:hypothetical protein